MSNNIKEKIKILTLLCNKDFQYDHRIFRKE